MRWTTSWELENTAKTIAAIPLRATSGKGVARSFFIATHSARVLERKILTQPAWTRVLVTPRDATPQRRVLVAVPNPYAL